jgi:hypothetical protein
MAFWSNFLRETGRNTGKWASNKIFGDTGWATPKRHILHGSDGKKRTSRSVEDSSNDEESSLATQLYVQDQLRSKRELKEKATQIQIDSDDVNVICTSIDELLTGARIAQQNHSSESIFTSKIRAGIMRLHRLGETEMADFYRSELNKVLFTKAMRKMGQLILAVLVFGGLIFFAFFL